MSTLIETALSSIDFENKYLMAAAPAVAIGVLSIGSRVTMGAMALACKGASSVVNYVDGDLSEIINETGDELMSQAKRSFTLELQLGAALTALTVTGIVMSAFLFDQPEVTTFDKVTDFIGLTTPQYSNMEHITNFFGLTVPITRTDQMIDAASWVGDKIGTGYSYLPSLRSIGQCYVWTVDTIVEIAVTILVRAPIVALKYAVVGSLKAIILPFQALDFSVKKVYQLYQCLPTIETIVNTALLPFTTAYKIVAYAAETAYNVVTWPLITAYNIVSWPFIQVAYMAEQVSNFVTNCIVWPIVTFTNIFIHPLDTAIYVYEQLQGLVGQLAEVCKFLELDDSVTQMLTWSINTLTSIVAWPFKTAYNIATSPFRLIGNIIQGISNLIQSILDGSISTVTQVVFSPLETAQYLLQGIWELLRSISKAISELEA